MFLGSYLASSENGHVRNVIGVHLLLRDYFTPVRVSRIPTLCIVFVVICGGLVHGASGLSTSNVDRAADAESVS